MRSFVINSQYVIRVHKKSSSVSMPGSPNSPRGSVKSTGAVLDSPRTGVITNEKRSNYREKLTEMLEEHPQTKNNLAEIQHMMTKGRLFVLQNLQRLRRMVIGGTPFGVHEPLE